jgi:hypothetical protein
MYTNLQQKYVNMKFNTLNINNNFNSNTIINDSPGVIIIYNGVRGCGMENIISDVGYNIPYKKDFQDVDDNINKNIKKMMINIENDIKLTTNDQTNTYNVVKIANPNLDPSDLENILNIAARYNYDVQLRAPTNYLLYTRSISFIRSLNDFSDVEHSTIINEQKKRLVSYNLKIPEHIINNDCKLSLELTKFINEQKNRFYW